MMQKPNTVIIGKQTYVTQKAPGAANALTVGDIVVINPANGNVCAIADLTSAVEAIQIGYVKTIGTTTADAEIIKSSFIKKNAITSLTANGTCAYVAKTEASSVVEFSGMTPTIGYRYVLRIVYKDLYEHPGQFTHSYEVIATSVNPAVLSAAFAARITTHTGSRVTATDDGTSTLTITAKVITGTGYDGVNAINSYSQVAMEVFAYVTNPSAAFSAQSAITGLTITTTASKPGRGNWKIVRDRERAALGYKGITNRTEYPVIQPDLTVDATATYDTLVIEYRKEYQSPDNQYVKTTDLAAEVYIVAGQGAEALRDGIAAWIIA
jgi:hypothetical protein